MLLISVWLGAFINHLKPALYQLKVFSTHKSWLCFHSNFHRTLHLSDIHQLGILQIYTVRSILIMELIIPTDFTLNKFSREPSITSSSTSWHNVVINKRDNAFSSKTIYMSICQFFQRQREGMAAADS